MDASNRGTYGVNPYGDIVWFDGHEGPTYFERAQASRAKCECGADKTYGEEVALFSGLHSDWCPKSAPNFKNQQSSGGIKDGSIR